jgi:hypothetical protein
MWPSERTCRSVLFYASECSIDICESGIDDFPEWQSLASHLDATLWQQATLSCERHQQHRVVDVLTGLPDALLARMQWLLINRIRYLYVSALARELKEQFVLWGDDWVRLGFATASPSNYSVQTVNQMYRTCRLSLDMGSKSCGAHIYPRWSDIIRAGGLPFQATLGRNDAGDGGMPTELIFDSTQECVSNARTVLALSAEEVGHLRTRVQHTYTCVAEGAMRNLAIRLSSLHNE